MTIYRPLLTTTPSDLDAALTTDGIGTTIQPVWGLVPAPSGSPAAELAGRLADCPRRVPWRIDTRHLATGGPSATSAVAAVDDACRNHGVTYVPVIEPGASGADAAAAVTAVEHHLSGLAVRLSSPTGASDIERAAATVRALGYRPAHADLILDCGYVPDALSASLTAGALLIPIYRAVTQGWRSVTVLAGSFPAAPPEVPRAIPRHEAAIFRQLPFHVDFGDFGATHPVPGAVHEALPPSLRWNRGDDWVRYTDAARIPRSVRLTGDASWADDPATWAEWSTAHHLAVIRQRLDRKAA